MTRGGSTRAWRALRANILARDHYVCRLRFKGVCVGQSRPMHAHHLHGPKNCAMCARDDPAHIVAACGPCNLHVGDPGTKQDPRPRPVTNWG